MGGLMRLHTDFLKRWIFGVGIAQVLWLPCAPVKAGVGEAVMVRNEVSGSLVGSGQSRKMALGDDVGLGLQLVTRQASAFRMRFEPQGNLTPGASTGVTVDEPVVDRATGRSTSRFSVGLGRNCRKRPRV